MKKYIFSVAVLAGMISACTKDAYKPSGANPYAEQVQPAITLKKNGINPVAGNVGDVVEIGGRNFLKNKDKLSFLFNNVKAEIVELTDTTAKIKVPSFAATGNVTAQVGQEYYYGPFFRVKGVFEMDSTFPGNSLAANGPIYDIIPLGGDKYLAVGDFDRYGSTDNNQKGMKRVVRINKDGKWDESFANGMENGSNSAVYGAYALKNTPYYLVAGGFSSYGGVGYCNGIAAVYNSTGGVVSDKVINAVTKTEYNTSIFKGGVSGAVTNILVKEGSDLASSRIILTGGFDFYVQPNFQLINYEGRDSIHLDSIRVNQIIQLKGDGSIDSTFNYDLVNHRGKTGPNGYIGSAKLLPDGKILIAGSFTKYNDQAVSKIARLNPDGSLDPTFNPGSGPDLNINSLTLQPDGKIIAVGGFNTFAGVKAPHIVRLNPDGSVDATFNVGTGTDEYLVRADLMPGGEIIVSGFFSRFNGYYRNNVMVLNPNGSIHPTYNSNGALSLYTGNSTPITKIIPVEGEKALFVVGGFTNYDFRPVQRLVKIKYQ
ncbi:delta-60 repeat domain-containing protein [Chitinophaga terrae (ex Kim and Jung 2007)]|uniref:Delta-60 repeat domain-containing protein n=1 Tax=Chitinophaga terrae (ex Kim and Jung 2007) TaxID=408074 RepID=A0A1H4BJN1_9BACT|nr:IPT/TIG domain-containing protein [Chitinophaga terrae (ex Kim and Jung 2007)]MDQ0109363.1 putative delta-60 repeat protein [Chitinophaga terrae (ex Kim and Jung 2007)]GEP89602.1 hypothetical protein CTE07_12470 [Chitinophaga terrae (ex Kim and Jung 2007)]SEA48330.1 delta-60 repeat domain-containing protein [Chitinophaga terrae (ex Kim and Jung 2007)]